MAKYKLPLTTPHHHPPNISIAINRVYSDYLVLKEARKLDLDKLYPSENPLRILQYPVGS